MKDRTPKYRGRVKLLPVTGQENIYDMTRADEPDDTGTPFNTRTMLQDSTAQFLKLPVSNPFVDDALRHMPDRVNPVGTIRTTPQQSLGDAWLPCDGSQVTFSEYPELCQILRNVSEAQWSQKTIGTAAESERMSNVVQFKGNWYVAGQGKDGTKHRITIRKSSEILGEYTISGEYEKTQLNTYFSVYNTKLVCSEDLCVAICPVGGTDGNRVVVGYTEDGDSWNWYVSTNNLGLFQFTVISACTDGVFWLVASERVIICSSNPKEPSSWSAITTESSADVNRYGGLSVVDGTFVLTLAQYSHITATPTEVSIRTSKNPPAGFTEVGFIRTGNPKGNAYLSSVQKFNGKYWFAYKYYKDVNAEDIKFAYSDDMKTWAVPDSYLYTNPGEQCNINLVKNDKFMIAQSGNRMKLIGDPLSTTSDISLPTGGAVDVVSIHGDIAIGGKNGVLYYNDYSQETRLLPTISLSSDTTTFIKAKKELDVFEAAQIGG